MLEQTEAGKFIQDLKMDVLQAIQYIIQAWEETTPTTIHNCWHHTKILSTNADILGDVQETDRLVLEEITETLDALHLPNRMGVNELLTIPDENVIYEIPEEDRLIATLADTFRKEENNLEEDDDGVEPVIISANMALKNLENVRTFLLQQEHTAKQIRSVSTLEKFIREKRVGQLQQSYIEDYFNL
jgi:hypothetical protein